MRAFHDEGPSLPATRGNLTIVVGVDKQKTNSYRGIVHILRPWWKMYYSEYSLGHPASSEEKRKEEGGHVALV